MYKGSIPNYSETLACNLILRIKALMKDFKFENPSYTLTHLTPLNDDSAGYKELVNMLDEVILHINAFGMYGAIKSVISYMIQLECVKKRCQDVAVLSLFNYILTILTFIEQILRKTMEKYHEKDQIILYSSDKILKLIDIFRKFSSNSTEELSAIVFTKRRFTAKIVYHILDGLSNCHPEFKHIKADYIVGYNNNPFNATRENLYITKKNKEVIEAFRNKEINVLVSSSVLEEGVDMQKCSLVVRFDLPDDYRGYVQSKGRARHKDSLYYMMVEDKDFMKFMKKYREFQTIESILNKVRSIALQFERTAHKLKMGPRRLS